MANNERPDRKKQLIDAAEHLLREEGPSGVTTRRVAAEAGMNQALVHYHFGSMNDLTLAVHDRMSDEYALNVVRIYTGDAPLVQKWRTHAGRLFGRDFTRGWPKIWLELSTLAANQPELRGRVIERLDFARSVFVEAVNKEIAAKGLDPARVPAEALAAMWLGLTEGMFVEKLLGYDRGHSELMAVMDSWLVATFGEPEPKQTGSAKRSYRAGEARSSRKKPPASR